MNRMTCGSEPRPSPARTVGSNGARKGKAGRSIPIRVLLADDHPVVRWGLSCCLAPCRQVTVVGEAGDGLEAVRKAKALSPHVVLMDIDMPEMNGLTATEVLRRDHPEIKVLLLSMHPYSAHITQILQSGARGFISKDARPADFIEAIARVAGGETCFSPELACQALNHLAQNRGGEPMSRMLTQREREVLVGIAEGLSNKSIATRLGISSRTIETHRGHIMRKLKIHSIAGLTRFAIAEGLVIVNEKAAKLKA